MKRLMISLLFCLAAVYLAVSFSSCTDKGEKEDESRPEIPHGEQQADTATGIDCEDGEVFGGEQPFQCGRASEDEQNFGKFRWLQCDESEVDPVALSVEICADHKGGGQRQP